VPQWEDTYSKGIISAIALQTQLLFLYNSAYQPLQIAQKKTIAKIKQIKDKIPSNPLDTLKKYNPTNNGASVKSRKPITEP